MAEKISALIAPLLEANKQDTIQHITVQLLEIQATQQQQIIAIDQLTKLVSGGKAAISRAKPKTETATTTTTTPATKTYVNSLAWFRAFYVETLKEAILAVDPGLNDFLAADVESAKHKEQLQSKTLTDKARTALETKILNLERQTAWSYVKDHAPVHELIDRLFKEYKESAKQPAEAQLVASEDTI